MSVAILLASYNGEKYISEQIESILNQTYQDFVLYIRDDGSTDKTAEIEKSYAEKYPEKIKIVNRKADKHGSKHNFWALCEEALETEHKYIMCCDQDDFWKNDKVKVTLSRMLDEESKNGDVPILVHTDLEVVDQDLKKLGDSFIEYRALDPDMKSIEKLLVQNNVTGCTMMLNRPLLIKAVKDMDVERIAMHDWWFALIASIFGKISFVNKATIKYRQHGGNVVGATKVNSIGFIWKRLTGSAHVKETLNMSVEQAKLILEHYSDEIDEQIKKPVYALADIHNHNKFGRVNIVMKHKILKQGKVQIIGELMFI